jgi:peptidoglycan/LPS O-acetylase OafA/YrhL
LVPMVSAGTILIVVQSLTPGVNNVHSGIPFVWPVAHLWFVQAIFLIFILVACGDRRRALERGSSLGLAFTVACMAYLFVPPVQVFAIGGATYLLPFFILGLAIGRLPQSFAALHSPIAQTAMVILVIFALLTSDLSGDRHTTLYLVVGIALCSLAAGIGVHSKGLIFLAKYSFSIYLFHVFFTAGSRIFLERAGVSNLTAHVATGILAGVAGPILVQVWLARQPLASLLLLGKPATERTPEPQQGAASFR